MALSIPSALARNRRAMFATTARAAGRARARGSIPCRRLSMASTSASGGPVRVACHPLLPVSPLTLRRIKGSAFDGNARRHLDSYVVHGCRSRSGGACLSLKSDERWRDTIWVKSVMRGRPRRSPESRPVESLNFAAFGIAYYPMIHLGSVSNRYFPQREETING